MNSQLRHCVLQDRIPTRQTEELTWAVRARVEELHGKDYEVAAEVIANYSNTVK